MNMPGRTYSASQGSAYRYGFNGKETSPEISSGAVSFEARIYDSRIGRFFSTDPREKEYTWQSTYVYFKNCPTSVLDVLGMGGGDPPTDPYKDVKDKEIWVMDRTKVKDKAEEIFKQLAETWKHGTVTLEASKNNWYIVRYEFSYEKDGKTVNGYYTVGLFSNGSGMDDMRTIKSTGKSIQTSSNAPVNAKAQILKQGSENKNITPTLSTKPKTLSQKIITTAENINEGYKNIQEPVDGVDAVVSAAEIRGAKLLENRFKYNLNSKFNYPFDRTAYKVASSKVTILKAPTTITVSTSTFKTVISGLKFTGYGLGAVGIGSTLFDIATGKEKLIGRGGVDLAMGVIGFFGPIGFGISTAYNVGKWLDFW